MYNEYLLSIVIFLIIFIYLSIYEPNENDNEDSEVVEAKVIKVGHLLQHTFIIGDNHMVRIIAEEQV